MTSRHPTRRTALATLAAATAALALPAHSQTTKVAFGYTAVGDFLSVLAAVDQGYFSKRGLEVEPKFIPLNSTIPAAIQSGSLQIGGPTPSVFLQSVDGGLDQVVLAGGGVLSKTYTELGVVARAGSGIKTPQDFVGKKVGVPGLGAFLHVTFRAWLKDNKVDYKKVNFVEASFPQHGDLLRGARVMRERGFFQEPIQELFHLEASIFRAARIVVDTSLHLGEMTVEEAIGVLQRRLAMPEPTARAEVGQWINRVSSPY